MEHVWHKDIPETLEDIAGILRASKRPEAMRRKDQIKYLCQLTGIQQKTIATAILLESPETTREQLAKQLGVTVRTIYNWTTISGVISRQKGHL